MAQRRRAARTRTLFIDVRAKSTASQFFRAHGKTSTGNIDHHP